MPWVKLSDDWYDDPELIEVGPHAMLLWVVGLSWSARNLTDGAIPRAQARRLVDWTGCAEVNGMRGEDVTPDALTDRLVDAGLWKPDEWGGYTISNYLKYQPSRESVLATRERERQRWHDRKHRDSGETPDGPPRGVGTDSDPPPTDPVPVPVPRPSSSSQDNSQADPPPDDDGFDWKLVWRLIAEWKATQQPKPVGPGWVKATARNQPLDIYGDGMSFAERGRTWLEFFDIDERAMAELLTGRRMAVHCKKRSAA